MEDATVTSTSLPALKAESPAPPPAEKEEGEPAAVMSSPVSLIGPPDFFSASGLLDTRTSSGEESLGLRVVYLAQGRLDAKNVHYALISDRAELYTWGSGAFGRLGHGSTDNEARPRLVEALAKQRIRWVACGWDTTAAVTEHGELYLWGSGEAIPRSVSFPGEGALRVVKVCLGEAHAAVLSERGDVYTFGAFAHGRKTKRVAQRRQRGQKGWARDPQPRIVYNLPNGQTRNIACGSHHILALTSNGKVYSWGDGSWGKLGHGSETEEWLPRPIGAFDEQTIVQIDAGDDHSAFLSNDGTVWTCGCPHDGRLGLTKEAIKEQQEEFAAEGPKKDAAILVPSPVGGSLASHQVVSICAGAAYTLCRTLTKELFYFGKPEFDEALGVAHSPTALAIESYPLSAMFSRAYRSMIIKPPVGADGVDDGARMEFTHILVNDDKKAASYIQKPKESPQLRFLRSGPRRGSFPEIGKIATVKGIWDKRGKTLSDHDAETLRQAVATRKTNAAKSQMTRQISDSQLGDEEMVGRNCSDQETSPVSPVSTHVTADASAAPELKPQALVLSTDPEPGEPLASSQSFTAPTSTATTSAASKTNSDSTQPTSEQASDTKREPADDVDSADGSEEASTETTDALSETAPQPATQGVDRETPQHQKGADSDNEDDRHSDGDDEEDIRGETPRQRPDNVSHTPEGKETHKGKKEADDEDGSATEGEDEEDIRLETPRTEDRALHQKPASAKEGDGVGNDDDDHAITEGEDEEDIRGELSPRGQTPRKLPLEAVAGRSKSKGKGKKDDEGDDEPTEGEDEEDIRGETPRGKETNADLVKGISFSGSTISKFSDSDDDTLTEGDDEQDIRGEDDEPLWVDVHLAAVAQMEKSTTKEEKKKKKKSSREKKSKKKQPEPKRDEEKVITQEQQKKEEGNSARRIVRNISLKLIGKSATIERDTSPKEKKNKKTKGLKKSNTLTASPRISRDRPSAESDERRGKASADSLSSVKTASGSLSGDAVASVADDEDSGQWTAATAASPVRRRSRGFLSGRIEATSDNAAGEDGENSKKKKKEHRKSREKLSIRRSVSCEPSVGHLDEPAGGDEGGGGLKVQIRHSQEVETKRKSREVAEKRASKEVDNNGAGRERRASGGFAEKAIERRSKELHMSELEKVANDKADDVSEDAPTSDKSNSPSPFKKFHTIGRAHRKRNKTINSGAVSDSMEAVPTKQKRFSISTPFHSFSSTNRTRTNFTQEGAQLKEFERRLKNVKPGALEERAALLKEWAEFLLAQQASKQPEKAKNGGSVTSSPAASPLPSPKKGRFGTLRRRKKDEEKDPATEDLDEDVAGTIINNEEILLRLQSGEMIRLAYKETKRSWVEDRSAPPEVSVSPPPSPSPPASPSASPAGSPRTPGRSRLPRVPLFRTHSLSLNFLRGGGGGGSEKKIDRIDRNGGEGESCSETASGKNLSRQKSDARIGANAVDRLTRVEEESFSDVWRREKERQLAEAEEQKRQAERKQRKKQKEKEWALKGEAKESERSKERQSVREDEQQQQHSRHSESDYSSSDLKLETAPEPTTHSTEPCEQEA